MLFNTTTSVTCDAIPSDAFFHRGESTEATFSCERALYQCRFRTRPPTETDIGINIVPRPTPVRKQAVSPFKT